MCQVGRFLVLHFIGEKYLSCILLNYLTYRYLVTNLLLSTPIFLDIVHMIMCLEIFWPAFNMMQYFANLVAPRIK